MPSKSATTPARTLARLIAVGAACATALTVAAPLTVPSAEAASGQRHHHKRHHHHKRVPKPTTITVNARSNRGPVRPNLLGVNHRFVSDGHGMWDVASDQPKPAVVRNLRRAGVDYVRYPGGIVGNLFDWKKSIGALDTRGCQTSGQWTPEGYHAVQGRAYGPDEHMELVKAVGGKAIIMMPFATGTPADAADWVEYMNSPADGDNSNPNDGVDWAEVRAANGHRAPYRVRMWEVGNEQRVNKQRYWMSPRKSTAMRQYAYGDTVPVRDEWLGRGCRHTNAGVPSRGIPREGEQWQTFQLLYPPVVPDSVRVEVVDAAGVLQQQWTDGTLADADGDDQVYEVDEQAGEVRFGNGSNGAVLPRGWRVRASYQSKHSGVFSFIRRMKEVDPSIDVCVTWGLKDFVPLLRGKPYDCFSAHAYTNFAVEGTQRWRNPVQGHDRHMLGAQRERDFIADLKRSLPARKPLALTEFGAIWGKTKVYPQWTASMTRATYMASMWVNLLDLGVPLAIGSDLLAPSNRGLLGPPPKFTFSAEALTRQAIRPMLDAGGRRLAVTVTRNPVRNPHLGGATYPALAVAATRARNRDLYLLVVNRLPGDAQRVRARLDLRRFTSRRVAYTNRVNGATFRSWNVPGVTQVRLRRTRQRIGPSGFTYVFPPHSVSVLRVPSR